MNSFFIDAPGIKIGSKRISIANHGNMKLNLMIGFPSKSAFDTCRISCSPISFRKAASRESQLFAAESSHRLVLNLAFS